MSVNSIGTYLRQQWECIPRSKSDDYIDGYLQCIRDFEAFGD